MDLIIRPYRGSDEAALLQLWNACLWCDPISPSALRTRVLLDPNFIPESLLLAELSNRLVGFVLSITRQVPLFLQGLEPGLGWITAFGVDPQVQRQGIGRRLFAAALERLQTLGCRQVLISPYTPNYFIPGVDPQAYPEAAAFLKSLGWKVTSEPVSMQADLTTFQVPGDIFTLQAGLCQQGASFSPIQSADLPELMPFIAQTFGWDWYRHAQEYLLEIFGRGSDEIAFWVARLNGEIVGYCQQRRERFGPFGVSPQARSKGFGRVLLCRCLEEMRAKGFHSAWFLWTGRINIHIYSLAGFRVVRAFQQFEYDLGVGE